MTNVPQQDLAPGELSLQRTRTLLSKTQRLHDILERLQSQANHDTNAREGRSKQLAEARACIPSKEEFGSDKHLILLCPEYIPPHAADTAQKVFGIPELLERILLYLNVKELLAVPSSISGGASATNSDENAKERSGTDVEKGERFAANIHAEFDGNIPRIGSKAQKMLVVQPVIRRIEYFTGCCDEKDKPKTLERLSGVTIGDLAVVAIDMACTHRECPYASGYELNEYGFVDVKTTFRAQIELQCNDPIVQGRKEEDAKRRQKKMRVLEQERELDRLDEMMEVFAGARRMAHDDGRELPDFESWRDGWDPVDED